MSDKEGVKIETKAIDDSAHLMLVSVTGYVDQANCHLLQKTINTCINDEYYNLVFNLQQLVYMSSAGWGVLIGEIKRFRESGGDIKLANMGPEIYEIYQMLEFYHIISEFPSIEEAVKSFNISGNLEALEDIVVEEKSSKSKKKSTRSTRKKKKTDHLKIEEEIPKTEDFVEEDSEQEVIGTAEETIAEEEIDINIEGILASEGIMVNVDDSAEKTGYIEFDVSKYEREPDIKMMPVPDKIRHIISKNPDYGIMKIRKALRQPDYGILKIGFWKLRSLLRSLELDTKEKRYRFYRSA